MPGIIKRLQSTRQEHGRQGSPGRPACIALRRPDRHSGRSGKPASSE